MKTSSTKNDTEGNSKTSATKERRGHQQQLESVDDNNDRYKDGKYSGGNQISDDDLFKRPPPPKDCPICLLPLPSLISGSIYMNCCGKTICSGCIHAPVYDDKGNVMTKCPFCISVAK